MRGILIPTGGNPREIDIEPDGNGSVLKSLQTAVNGNIDVLTWFSETVSAFTSMMTAFLRSRRTGPFTPKIEVRDLDGLAFELSIVGDVLEPDNMNKDGLADLGEEL